MYIKILYENLKFFVDSVIFIIETRINFEIGH